MQNEWWMRPALQKSEAVLLPALERRTVSQPRFSHHFTHTKPTDDVFLPVNDSWQESENKALSTYVRSRGSMAGRGVLRAVGVHTASSGTSARPRYAAHRACLTQMARRRWK